MSEPVKLKLPDPTWTACGGCCTICCFMMAIITMSMITLQHYVLQFQSHWVEWYYIDDFNTSAIHTADYNGCIDYNNPILLHSTIFNPADNNASIAIYESFEMEVHLHTTQRLNELKLTLYAPNHHISKELLNDIYISSEFFYPVINSWLQFETSIDTNNLNETNMVTVVSKPRHCHKAERFKVTINNNDANNYTNYYITNISLRTYKNEILKTQNVVYLCIFGIIFIYNVIQWMKIACGPGIVLYKRHNPSKFNALSGNIVITVYCMLLTGFGLSVNEKWFTQPTFYSIQAISSVILFDICFVTEVMKWMPFWSISWAFENAKFHSNTWWITRCVPVLVVTHLILFITSIVRIQHNLPVDGWNSFIAMIMYLSIGVLAWSEINIALDTCTLHSIIRLDNYCQTFDEKLFLNHYLKEHVQFALSIIRFIWIAFMIICMIYLFSINLSTKDYNSCVYFYSVAVHCTLHAYFYPITIQKHWKCTNCSHENTFISNMKSAVCRICGDSSINKTSKKEDPMQEPMDQEMPVKQTEEISQNMNIHLFETDKLIGVEANCSVYCESMQRLKELCAAFTTETQTVFTSIFTRLTDYNLTALINDYVHFMESHQDSLQSMDDLIGICPNKQNCSMLRSPQRNEERKSLLFNTMKQLHNNLYHNKQRHEGDNVVRDVRRKRFCNIFDEVDIKCDIDMDSKEQEMENKEQQQVEKEEIYQGYTYNEYGFGSFIYYDLLQPKYMTFKEELLNNNMYCIDISVWSEIFEKAELYIHSNYAKRLRNIFKDTIIGIQHLISIICYTDYTVLCNNFRKSFRKLDIGEFDKDIIQRHCNNYYHFGKWLNEAISDYGCLVSSCTKALYHGLNAKYLFKSLCTDFNIPTSTTTEIIVAQRFAENGFILQLKPKWKHQSRWNKATCLSVEWISKFPEGETLFFGNFNQLFIEDILYISPIDDSLQRFKDMIQAVLLWEIILDGYIEKSDINIKHSSTTHGLLRTLIKRKLNKVDTDDVSIPHYIVKLFDYICMERKLYSTQGIKYVIANIDDGEWESLLTELKIHIKDPDVLYLIKCGRCMSGLYEGTIEENWYCGACGDSMQGENGYLCSTDCVFDYCICYVCAEFKVLRYKILPNALLPKFGRKKIYHLDEVKDVALGIQLLKSKGLW